MGLVNFVITDTAGYAGINSKNTDTLYFVEDTRKIYKGETEYGDVIGDYQNDASDDAKNTGDDDLEGAIGDYFDELYGEGNNNQTNP